MGYKLKLDMFEGPLDLLLYLIRKNEIDIVDIPIVDITDQYLEYIEMMKLLDLEVVGDFLVMAATLIQIKSRMLLPPDPDAQEDEEEDPRDELVRRLQEYKQFKEIAEDLGDKASSRADLFSRRIDEEMMGEIKDDATEVYFEANLFDLINALNDALSNRPQKTVYEVEKEEYTIEEKMHSLLNILVDKPKVNLRKVFDNAKSKSEVITTFLAVLELIRLKEIMIMQQQVFGDIEVIKTSQQVAREPGFD